MDGYIAQSSESLDLPCDGKLDATMCTGNV
jgi:hypothetical protein